MARITVDGTIEKASIHGTDVALQVRDAAGVVWIAGYDLADPAHPRSMGRVAAARGLTWMGMGAGTAYVLVQEWGVWRVDAIDFSGGDAPRIRRGTTIDGDKLPLDDFRDAAIVSGRPVVVMHFFCGYQISCTPTFAVHDDGRGATTRGPVGNLINVGSPVVSNGEELFLPTWTCVESDFTNGRLCGRYRWQWSSYRLRDDDTLESGLQLEFDHNPGPIFPDGDRLYGFARPGTKWDDTIPGHLTTLRAGHARPADWSVQNASGAARENLVAVVERYAVSSGERITAGGTAPALWVRDLDDGPSPPVIAAADARLLAIAGRLVLVTDGDGSLRVLTLNPRPAAPRLETPCGVTRATSLAVEGTVSADTEAVGMRVDDANVGPAAVSGGRFRGTVRMTAGEHAIAVRGAIGDRRSVADDARRVVRVVPTMAYDPMGVAVDRPVDGGMAGPSEPANVAAAIAPRRLVGSSGCADPAGGWTVALPPRVPMRIRVPVADDVTAVTATLGSRIVALAPAIEDDGTRSFRGWLPALRDTIPAASSPESRADRARLDLAIQQGGDVLVVPGLAVAPGVYLPFAAAAR
ncbi:MAG: hypothetical protein U0470_06575 [Anaerolineae bacterium]